MIFGDINIYTLRKGGPQMTDEQNEQVNTLTFEFRPERHTSVSPIIDGKNFLEEWDLGGIYRSLSSHELVDPILALDEIYSYCECVSMEYFNLASCTCGYTGCGSVGCDIKLEYGHMTWSNFRNSGGQAVPHIGPFTFDWDQVIEDLRRARDAHRASFPPLSNQ